MFRLVENSLKSFRYLSRYFDFNVSDEDQKYEVYDTLTHILNEIDNLPLHPKTKFYYTVVVCFPKSIVISLLLKCLEHPISATLSRVLLSQSKCGLNIILPLTKFLQRQTASRLALKSSPDEVTSNL